MCIATMSFYWKLQRNKCDWTFLRNTSRGCYGNVVFNNLNTCNALRLIRLTGNAWNVGYSLEGFYILCLPQGKYSQITITCWIINPQRIHVICPGFVVASDGRWTKTKYKKHMYLFDLGLVERNARFLLIWGIIPEFGSRHWKIL